MLSTYQELETPDFDTWIISHDIVGKNFADGQISLTWHDGKISNFHYLWLREHCPCSLCHSDVTREQILDVLTLPNDLVPVSLELTENGYLVVIWSDGHHKSIYHPGWLRANSYDDWARQDQHHKKPTWDASFSLPIFEYEAVMEDDRSCYKWLSALDRYGLVMLKNVPTDLGTVGSVASRIGYVKSSNFGELFEVETKPDADSNAYLSVGLPLHTDLPTREIQPGLQFLHCLINDADGGESIFADTFHIAKVLEREQPSIYELITRLKFPFSNRADYRDYRFAAPLIELDRDGAPLEARVNTFLHAPITNMPHECVPKAYEARNALLKATLEDRFRLYHRLQAGEMVIFDNRRVLHARTEFFPNTGARKLQGCYMDRDELKSAIRMLERANRQRGEEPLSPYVSP
jgi:gamma-butyrobetaine hydroxylase